MNPCRCGYLAEPGRACGRAPRCAVDYQARMSGPLLDRIDLHIDVPAVSAADLALPPPAESSAEIARRVHAARDPAERALCQITRGPAGPHQRRGRWRAARRGRRARAGRPRLLVGAAERLRLSARGYHRVLRVARTLADLDGAATVARRHIAEALSYRRPLALTEQVTGG